ncbi:MAG: 2-oxo acid dehydrogenase subunit E2 [Byssovorax sp.]
MRGAKLSGWRRIASAMWDAPNDPQIYGALDIPAGPVLDFMARARAEGHHVTPTHLVGRAVAHGLAQVPDLNVRLHNGRAVARSSVEVFFITAVEGGHDLSGVKIEHADEKSAVEVSRELDLRAKRLKQQHDPTFTKVKRTMEALPHPLLRLALRVTCHVANELDRDFKSVGVERSPFGSAMVSSVGMFGLPHGFAPISWMYPVPALILVGEITDKPLAIQGKVEVRPVIPICATLDHRYMDGWHISRLLAHFKEYLANPPAFEPDIEVRRAFAEA